MNLKKTLLSFMAVGAILAGSISGVAAQDDSDSQSTQVVVNTNTAFDAYFCNATTNFGTVSLSSSTLGNEAARTKTGTTTICYLDTTSQRQSFNTMLQAGSFTGTNGGSISNSQLSIARVDNPKQGQWSSDPSMCGPNIGTNRPCIGDISGKYGNGNATVPNGGADWVGDGSLDNQLKVNYGYNGAGTAGTLYRDRAPFPPYNSRLNNGSFHDIELKLIVPQNTPAGTYTGTLNLYIYMNAADAP